MEIDRHADQKYYNRSKENKYRGRAPKEVVLSLPKKRLDTLRVNPKIIEQWDKLADVIGINRTAMIHNAIVVYKLFINNNIEKARQSNKRILEFELELERIKKL